MFPFIGAALNWIFYAQFNTQFRKGLTLVSERIVRTNNNRLVNFFFQLFIDIFLISFFKRVFTITG